MTSAQELEITHGGKINNGGLTGSLSLLGSSLDFLGEVSPKLIKVEGGAVLSGSLKVEVSHTNLTEVTRVARKGKIEFAILQRKTHPGRLNASGLENTYNLSKRIRC